MRPQNLELSGKVVIGCVVVLAILLTGLLWLLRAPAAPDLVKKTEAGPPAENSGVEESPLAVAKRAFFAAQASKPAAIRPALNVAEVKKPAVRYDMRPRQAAAPAERGEVGFLTGPAPGDALDVVKAHLQATLVAAGFSEADFADPLVSDRYVSEHNGVTHLYLRQRHLGIEVYNGDLNVNLTKDNRIISLNNGFVSNLAKEITATEPVITAEKAVQNAAAHLEIAPPPALATVTPPEGPARKVVFEGGSISLDPIPAKLMFLPQTNKQTRLVWNTVLRLPDQKRWLEMNVDAQTGAVLSESTWMAEADYRVYAFPLENPDSGPRTAATNSHDPTASPHGWHDTDGAAGAEFTDTRGNNVNAQEDTDANNTGGMRPSGGAGLEFDFPLDLAQQPTSYISASVTNLFYWNNILHDLHYHYGFTEQAGNFQKNNYSRGGTANDPVQADGLDGSGLNNANFGTPPDGYSPRMQMFVWTGPPGGLRVNSPAGIAATYPVSDAEFGPLLTLDRTANLVLANDGSSTPTLARFPLVNAAEIAGNIALVDRGANNFVEKVKFAQMAGAVGVVVANNVAGEGTFTMAGYDPTITIPAFMIRYEDGHLIRAQLLGGTVNVTLRAAVDRDSSLDSGVIIHEYGHGVSNRLTGGPANASALQANQSRGMGEGWSDFWALALTAKAADTATAARGMGNYLLGQNASGAGIRPARYTTSIAVNPLTYGDIGEGTLSIPHGIGTVWCTALWEMYWELVAAHGFDPDLYHGDGGNNVALQLVMDGLKLQPANPSFLEARDAILMADQINNAGANRDRIWRAFAKRGMGFSAYDGGSSSSLDVIEAFDVPDQLLVTPGADYIFMNTGTPGNYDAEYQIYTLKNTGTTSLNWTGTAPATWLDLTPSSGTLGPNQSVQVEAYMTGAAYGIGIGTFQDVVNFTCVNSGVTQQRRVMLCISELRYATGATVPVMSGVPPWFNQSTVSRDGIAAARSGDIGEDESSWMEMVFHGPDTITFHWKVSSEEHFDFLDFFVDGDLRHSISGEVDWTKVAITIPSGNHTLRWEYNKDYSLSDGLDAGFVDQITRTFSQAPTITSELTALGYTGRPFSYQIQATSNPTTYSCGPLPSGLTFTAATGLISGTPTVTGTFPVNITAQNGSGSKTESLKIELRQIAALPFSENFETGTLSSYWLASKTNIGRVYTTQTFSPRGAWHLILDAEDNQGSRGELDLAIDLSGQQNVLLTFWAKEYKDESHGPPASPFLRHADFDGVAISEDGVYWYEVQPLRGELRANYQQFYVDLDAAIAARGLSYNSTFRIRFNHFGVHGAMEDGIALDDIGVVSAVLNTTLETTPGQVPGAQQFSGVANPGAVIRLYSNRDGLIGTATANGSGVWTINAAGLSAGTHRITASVHGLPRATTVVTASAPPPTNSTYELIPFGSLWKYLDNGTDQYSPTPKFYSPNYSDQSWNSGNARLGYGGDGEATIIDYGPDSNQRYRTSYFRKTFVYNAKAYTPLYEKAFLSLRVDDGAVVYLNGVELTRFNMLPNPVTYLSRGRSQAIEDEELAAQAFEFDPALLQDGSNLLAVSLHQDSDVSGDAGFDLRLALTRDAFTEGQNVMTEAGTEQILLRDVNQDGRMDLIYTSDSAAGADQVKWAPGLPNGSFGTPVVIDANFPNVDQIVSEDLDNNGTPDLLATYRESYAEQGIRVYLNTAGTYAQVQHLPNFHSPDMELADFNGDGFKDLVYHRTLASVGGPFEVEWCANNQSGQFGAPQLIARIDWLWDFEVADVDRDGDIDVAAAVETHGRIYLWKNNGSGGFPSEHIVYNVSGCRDIAFGDFDGDNDLDLAMCRLGQAFYAKNNGSGGFSGRYAILPDLGGKQMHVGDFDQDGDMDLANLCPEVNVHPEWSENDGRGNFTGARRLNFGNQSTLVIQGLTTGDLDGDGLPDLLATETGTGKVIFYRNQRHAGPAIASFTTSDNTVEPGASVTLTWDASGAAEVRLNGEVVAAAGSKIVQVGSADTYFLLTARDADGMSSKSLTVFVPKASFDSEVILKEGPIFSSMRKIAAGDIDGNGTQDIVFISPGTLDLGWLSNDGAQGFSAPIYLDQDYDGIAGAIAEDFDKDGDVDIAAIATNEPPLFFRNNGGGTFAAAVVLAPAVRGQHMRAQDANNDGYLDLVVSDTVSGFARVFVNNHIGGWTGNTSLALPPFTDCRVVDLNGDGKWDFIHLTPGAILVYPGTGTLVFPQAGGYVVTPVQPLNLKAMEMADYTGDGKMDIVYLESASPGFLKGLDGSQFEGVPGVFQNFPADLVDSASGDLDGDGDLDLAFLTQVAAGPDAVVWVENDGLGTFSEPQPITSTIEESYSIELTDLDQDGDLDILSPGADDSITWIRNLSASNAAVQLNADSDSGTLSDNRTNQRRPDFTGTATPGTTVTLISDVNGIIGTAVADGLGQWSITSAKLAEGVHRLTVQTGNGAVAGSVDLTIDTDVMPPSGLSLDPASDNGASNSDRITSIKTPVIHGNAEAGSSIVLTSSRDGVIGNGTANAEFWIQTATLTTGVHQIRATATDLAGNVSELSLPLSITIADALAPAISLEQPAGTPLTDGTSAVSFGMVTLGGNAQRTFTIRNGNSETLTGLAVSVDGAQAANFVPGAIGNTSLAAGETTTFTVTFTPSGASVHNAALHVSSTTAQVAVFDVSLNGTGMAPEIALEHPAGTGLVDGSSTVAFGSSTLGGNVIRTFTIGNTGNDVLTGLAVTVEGSQAAHFVPAALGATTVQPGQTLNFNVTFTPTAVTSYSAALRLTSNDADESPFDVTLSGTGVGPEIVVEEPAGTGLTDNASTINFGEVNPSSSHNRVITVRNTGGGSLTGLSANFTGTNPADFSAGAFGLTTLPPGGSTTFTLNFVPAGVGTRSASLRIFSNDADENPFEVAVTGTVVVPEIAVEHPEGTNLTDGAAAVSFGSIAAGQSGSRAFTIRNTGTGVLSGLAVTFVGSGAPDYSHDLVLTSLNPGSSATFNATFSPSVTGLRGATMRIASNDANENPFDIALNGIGMDPEIGIEHPANQDLTDGGSTISFGSTNLGTPVVRTLNIFNRGNATLSGLAVNVTGDYSATQPAVTSLEGGNSTTFNVTFSPTAAGVRAGTIQVSSNDRNENPFDIALTGTGTQPEIAIEQPAGTGLTDGVSQIAFGVQQAGANVVKTFTVRNTGTGPLTGLTALVIGENAAEFVPGAFGSTTVAAGNSTTFNVTFTPAALGERSVILRVGSNDADENPFDLTLTATVAQPEIVIEQPAGTGLTDGAATVDFGSIVGSVPASKSLTFVIRNSGASPLTNLAASIVGTDAGRFSVPALPTSLDPSQSLNVTVTFTPTQPGARTATLRIASNDADENPFEVTLTGSKLDRTTLRSWAESFGLSGPALLPTADTDLDGVTLLEEYAFNLNPTLNDGRDLIPGSGTSGRPAVTLGAANLLQVEYLRRRSDPDLVYVVEFASDLTSPVPTGFAPATEAETVTPVSLNWERVMSPDTPAAATLPRRFGRVKVMYSPPTP